MVWMSRSPRTFAFLQMDPNTMGEGTCSDDCVWPARSAESVVALTDAFATMKSDKLTWFPEFGCALLAAGKLGSQKTDTRASLGMLTLHLVCLDSWKFVIHR